MLKKGTKFKNGYSTVTKEGGVDYREVSKKLKKEHGIDIAHTSCRNYTIRAMETIAKELLTAFKVDDVDYKDLAKSPNFQNAFGSFIINNY
jgi:hypothetical protein